MLHVHAEILWVTLVCHDSRAAQPGGLLPNSPAFAVPSQSVLTCVMNLTIHFASLQCCDMLHAVVLSLCHVMAAGQGSLVRLLLLVMGQFHPAQLVI